MLEAADTHQDVLRRAFPRRARGRGAVFYLGGGRQSLIYCSRHRVPAFARCSCNAVSAGHGGKLFERLDCGHQTSVMSGKLFHGTRKPLRDWFRAIFDVCVHRAGVSSADVQRILGFGSYGTAWHCRAMREGATSSMAALRSTTHWRAGSRRRRSSRCATTIRMLGAAS